MPIPTRWWLRPVSRQARVGEQMAVVWKLVSCTPRSARASMCGVAMSEP
jgi:hypothetical protein